MSLPERFAFMEMKVQAAALQEVRSMVEACPDGPLWPDDVWKSFAQAASSNGPQRISQLVRDDAGIAGWITGTMLREVADLEFLLISPARRRSGLGRSLLKRWLQQVRQAGASEVFLEVRSSNDAAVGLYTAVGFAPRGVRRGYYSHPIEDAAVMHLRL